MIAHIHCEMYAAVTGVHWTVNSDAEQMVSLADILPSLPLLLCQGRCFPLAAVTLYTQWSIQNMAV